MKRISVLILAAGLTQGCKKEPTTWQSEWSAPVAYGHMTINDMIPVEYTAVNADNYLSLVYHEAVYEFSLDTLIDLPDTTILKKSAIGVPNLTVNPAFEFYDSFNQSYDLDQIELKKVMVRSGTLNVEIKCPWPGMSIITFTFPKVTYQGTPFSRTYQLPAASVANPATATETVDISDFMIDLTGTDGNQINKLSVDFAMGSNESSASFDITNTDSIEYLISFKDLVPKYAKGYFGQYYFSDTVGFSLDFMKNITGGQIDIDSIDMTITVKNGFNLVAQSTITQVTGINTQTNNAVNLGFPLLNTSLNINPATGGMYNFTPSEYPIAINNSNSNIVPFIENMSDSVLLGYELEINPFGNITAGADEFFPGSEFELFLDAEFPMEFGANDVTLADTFEIDYAAPEDVVPNNGEFVLKYVNAFPLKADAVFYLADVNGVVIDSIIGTTGIVAGSYNSTTYITTPYSGEILFLLTADHILNLDVAEKVILNVAFSTDQSQVVRIDANAFFDFNLRSNLNISVEF
jgi:hypothetical protein